MTWRYLNCGDPTLCDAKVQELLQTYDNMNRSNQLPLGAAIFARHESLGDLHCDLVLYFNPEAEAVAKAEGAASCAKPLLQGLSQIAPSN
ncbi:Uncharacterised protein [Halioglobus japonicus]|nr:Uncharacterised protein [Halioglobus japonicus]